MGGGDDCMHGVFLRWGLTGLGSGSLGGGNETRRETNFLVHVPINGICRFYLFLLVF